MKIGLIGDVHAEDRLLEVALHALTAAGCDLLVCVGDIADGAGSVDHCVRLLQDHAVLCVRGNHDEWLLTSRMRDLRDATRIEDVGAQTLSFLRDLPATLEIPTPDGLLLLCHGVGPNNMARLDESDFDFAYAIENHPELQTILAGRRHAFVVSGHSHQVFLRVFRGLCFVKAGTLKRGPGAGYAVLDTAVPTLTWTAIDLPGFNQLE